MRPGFDNADEDQPQDGGAAPLWQGHLRPHLRRRLFPLELLAGPTRHGTGCRTSARRFARTRRRSSTRRPTWTISVGCRLDRRRGLHRSAGAFKFQKSFDPTCTCKPPNKSWVEALADAEKLLDRAASKDVTVTAKMSDEMARPVDCRADAGKAANFGKEEELRQGADQGHARRAGRGRRRARRGRGSGANRQQGIGRDRQRRGSGRHVVKTDEGQVKTGARRRTALSGASG